MLRNTVYGNELAVPHPMPIKGHSVGWCDTIISCACVSILYSAAHASSVQLTRCCSVARLVVRSISWHRTSPMAASRVLARAPLESSTQEKLRMRY